MNSFKVLHELGQKAAHLSAANTILGWDQETYMPKEGIGPRTHQRSILASLHHEILTSNEFKNHLELAEKDSALSTQQKAAVREWRRDFKKASALSQEFVEDYSRTVSVAVDVWREAREKDNFSLFAPFLEKVVALSRQKAEYLGYKEKPLDALLDLYEPGATTKSIKELLKPLKGEIVPLLQKILASKKKPHKTLQGFFPKESQLSFSSHLAKEMGYDFDRGRLDLSAHPFCTASLHPRDCRITTRVNETDLFSCLKGVIHEAGHALYERNLPEEWYGSPLGESISMGMHESQSRFWETRIGQSLPFWKKFYPQIQRVFPEALQSLEFDDFYCYLNRVEPSLIRVEADEITYPLHVILRFEIEDMLINEGLPVKEVPALWNQKMKEYIGIVPPNDRLGCLQDIHWGRGYFGYFPTYTLGNMYAASLFNAFKRDHPDWEKRVEEGDLAFINEWQKQAVHQFGRQFGCIELLEKITKVPFSAEPYTDYLKEKYGKIYPGIINS